MPPSNGLTTRRSLLEALRGSSNDEAWREFLRLYQPLIFSWCLRYGLRGGDAEEVCAEVISKLVVAMRGFVQDPQFRFRGWLKTVVIHEAFDFFRSKARGPRMLSLDHPEARQGLDGYAAPPGFEQMAEALEEAVREGLRISECVRGRVSDKAWQAFWLTTVSGERPRQVAARLGMSVAAVYTAKSRVVRLLREEGAGRDGITGANRPEGGRS
ncbi:MAG: sigma-70 family RNA polymerase sigma factor [Isosphaeraceae bacterium]